MLCTLYTIYFITVKLIHVRDFWTLFYSYNLLKFDRTGVRSAVLLLPMTGVGWLIGLVANVDAVGFAYFFDVLGSLQVK